MEIPVYVKSHWPIILGGAAGLYVVIRILRGSSASSSTTDPTAAYLASRASMANQAASINAALQRQQLQASVAMAQTQAQAQVAQTQANAQLAASTGSAISGIISAQAQLPAVAINAAMADNQATMQNAAQVAIAGINSLPGDLNAQANQIVATSQQFNSYLNAAGQTQASFNANMPLLVNSVGQSAAIGTSAVARSAATAAQGNASSSGAMWKTVGTVAMIAAGA